MNDNDLRRALMSGVEGMQSFILDAEKNLSYENRVRLLNLLEEIPFSPIKYEILTSDADKIVKELMIGLLFGQIDAYVSQEQSIMNGYFSKFYQLCDIFSISHKFIVPIVIGVDDICSLF